MPKYPKFEARIKQIRERLKEFGVSRSKLSEFDRWVESCRRWEMSLSEFIIFVMIWPRSVLATPDRYLDQ